jgi:hypothetical protein
VKAVAGALAVFVAIAAAAFVLQRREEPSPVGGLAAVGAEPFGDGDELAVAAERVVLDGSGTRLAVITDDGLGVADRGALRPVTASGSHVVDAAWFGNGATLLVAEGPVPTGGLAVVDVDGHVRGTVPLSPSVGFGTGHGMVVLRGGKRAVVTAVERSALGPEQRHLVAVDLTTGATTPLTEGGGPDEAGPAELDDGRLAYTETTDPGSPPTVRVLDPSTGAAADAGPGELVAAAGHWLAVLRGAALVAVDVAVDAAGGADAATTPRTLVTVPAGRTVAAADPVAGQAVLVDRAGHLHRVRFDPVPITP